jgi:hypothetical protein
VRIQLTWTDPSGKQRQPILEPPIALGSRFEAMPIGHEGQRVTRLVLPDGSVADYHALIKVHNDIPLIIGQNVQINGLTLPTSTLLEGDVVKIGPFSLQVSFLPEEAAASTISQPVGSTVAPSAAMGVAPLRTPDSEPVGPEGCDRKVGFLFKRRCGRTSRVGCPHCDEGGLSSDPYFYEYNAYPGYGSYQQGSWGYTYSIHSQGGSSGRGQADFTEADAAAFESESDQDYEMDMGAS